MLSHLQVYRTNVAGRPRRAHAIAALTNDITLASESGTPTQFAQDHLALPAVVPDPTAVPEPATLGIGLASLTARRFKGRRRDDRKH